MEDQVTQSTTAGTNRHHRQHKVVSFNYWLLYIILCQVPVFNLVMLYYMGFSNRKASSTIKTFSRAYLMFLIFVYLLLLSMFLFFQTNLEAMFDCLKNQIQGSQINPRVLIID
jgi:hypothetical protein